MEEEARAQAAAELEAKDKAAQEKKVAEAAAKRLAKVREVPLDLPLKLTLSSATCPNVVC